jgi:hypothetical protein
VEVLSGQLRDAYLRDKIFGPRGMKDSGYTVSAEQRARQARVHARQADGSLVAQPWDAPLEPNPQFVSGGGPLYSTAPDHLTFLRMLLHGGAVNGVQLLKAETVAEMNRNPNSVGATVAISLIFFAPCLRSFQMFLKPGTRSLPPRAVSRAMPVVEGAQPGSLWPCVSCSSDLLSGSGFVFARPIWIRTTGMSRTIGRAATRSSIARPPRGVRGVERR